MNHVAVFDLDGTLAETAKYWLPILKEFQNEILRQHGISPALKKPEDALKLLGTSDRYLLGVMYPNRSEKEYAEFHALSNKLWKELMHRFPFVLYEGAKEVLDELKNRGNIILLSSNCDVFYMESLLEECNLKNYASGYACAGNSHGKEKWQFTRDMLQEFLPYEGYFIGDSAHDMIAGRKNGLKTIYADYGYAECNEPELIDHRVVHVRKILEIIH